MSGQRDAKKPARIIHPSQQSILRLVWRELWYLLFALLLFLPAWLLIIILMPISWLLAFFLDAFMSVFLKESYPGFERVSPWDAIWLARTDPSTPPVSVCLLTLERGLTFQEIKGLILDRMVLAKDDSDNIMYRRFMQKITSVLGCYAFVYDGAFDPSKHIILIPPDVSSLTSLKDYIAELTQMPMATNRPLWMLHIRTNFGPNGDTIILYRSHQALSDGISLVKILCRSVTDKTQEVYHIKSRFGGINFGINTIRSAVMANVYLFSTMLWPPRSDWNRRHGPFLRVKRQIEGVSLNGKESLRSAARKRDIYWFETSMQVLDRLSLVTRNSLHNILCACLTGALRSCLADGTGKRSPTHACTWIDLRRPLSTTTSAVEMGNRFVLLNLRLPLETIGSIPRLWKTRVVEDRLKNSSESTSVYWIVQILGHIVPVKISAWLVRRSIISGCTVSNLPGPDAQLSLNGKAIKSIVFWPFSITPNSALSVSFFSYGDKMHIGLHTDPDYFSAEELASCFSQEVTELSDLLSNRRAPGEIKRRVSEYQEPPQVLRTRILEVQRALQDAQVSLSTASARQDMNAWADQTSKVDLLREDLVSMLSVARRRKSLFEGVSMDFEEDEDMINEVRALTAGRRRTSSISSLEIVKAVSSGNRTSLSISRSGLSEKEPSSGPSLTITLKPTKKQSHVIYVTPDNDSEE